MQMLQIDDKGLNERVDLALNIIREAGQLILTDFHTGDSVALAKNDVENISTSTDILSEKTLIDHIRGNFPDDLIFSEESRMLQASGEFLWSIDPLDGTSNFAMEIPYFGLCLSLQQKGDTKFSCIYNPIMDDLAFAVENLGAFLNDRPIRIRTDRKTEKLVGFYIQGYGIDKNQETENIKALILGSRRVLNTWAPSLDWLSLLKGHADYIVNFHTETEDFLPGAFIYQQAGGQVERPNKMLVKLDLQEDRRVSAVAAAPDTIGHIHSITTNFNWNLEEGEKEE